MSNYRDVRLTNKMLWVGKTPNIFFKKENIIFR